MNDKINSEYILVELNGSNNIALDITNRNDLEHIHYILDKIGYNPLNLIFAIKYDNGLNLSVQAVNNIDGNFSYIRLIKITTVQYDAIVHKYYSDYTILVDNINKILNKKVK